MIDKYCYNIIQSYKKGDSQLFDLKIKCHID